MTCAPKSKTAVASACLEDDWLRENPPAVTYDGFRTNGVIVDEKELVIQKLSAAYRSVTGKDLKPSVATAVNDMRYYVFNGVPAVTFGACGGNSHAADEWLEITSMAPAAKTLGAFIPIGAASRMRDPKGELECSSSARSAASRFNPQV